LWSVGIDAEAPNGQIEMRLGSQPADQPVGGAAADELASTNVIVHLGVLRRQAAPLLAFVKRAQRWLAYGHNDTLDPRPRVDHRWDDGEQPWAVHHNAVEAELQAVSETWCLVLEQTELQALGYGEGRRQAFDLLVFAFLEFPQLLGGEFTSGMWMPG
jgi:hypothetical protein